jgi:hypothetical protein
MRDRQGAESRAIGRQPVGIHSDRIGEANGTSSLSLKTTSRGAHNIHAVAYAWGGKQPLEARQELDKILKNGVAETYMHATMLHGLVMGLAIALLVPLGR